MEIIKYLLWCAYTVVSSKDIETSNQDFFVGCGVLVVFWIIFLVVFGIIDKSHSNSDSFLYREFLRFVVTLIILAISFVYFVLL